MPHATPVPSGHRPGAATLRRRVLIVDDDRDIRETLEELLEQEGYAVFTARNGLEALAVARAERPSMILLDLFMPVMDGLEFIHQRAMDADLTAIPVVVVSAAADLQERVHSLAVAGHMEKPLHIEELLVVVARFCG
jgi:CheY-like chemotaxis protein